MKTPIPDEIVFIFDGAAGPCRDLIVFFFLRSKIKNDFSIGPLVTDHEGKITLTRKSVEIMIGLCQKEFPMDYAGGIEGCDLLSAVVESRLQLNQRAERLSGPYPENAHALRALLETASNSDWSFKKDIKIPMKDELVRITPPAAR